jgi:hypothetical protein
MKEIRLLKDLDLLHIGASSRAFPAIADGPGYVVHGSSRPDKQSVESRISVSGRELVVGDRQSNGNSDQGGYRYEI